MLRADIQILIRWLKFANEIFETHISLALIFHVIAQIILNLLNHHPFLFEKLIQFYGSAATAEMISIGRCLLLVKCSSLEFEVKTWAFYQY